MTAKDQRSDAAPGTPDLESIDEQHERFERRLHLLLGVIVTLFGIPCFVTTWFYEWGEAGKMPFWMIATRETAGPLIALAIALGLTGYLLFGGLQEKEDPNMPEDPRAPKSES